MIIPITVSHFVLDIFSPPFLTWGLSLFVPSMRPILYLLTSASSEAGCKQSDFHAVFPCSAL